MSRCPAVRHLAMRHKPLMLCIGLALGVPGMAVSDATARDTSSTFPMAQRPAMQPDARRLTRGPVASIERRVPDARPAMTRAVTHCADDGTPGSLRTIIEDAVSGDRIDLRGLDCSTIALSAGQIEIHVDELIIEGPGQAALTIDGGEASRIFQHLGAGTLELQGLTLANGRVVDHHGGCVSAESGAVSLTDARVTGCTAHDSSGLAYYALGGGIFAAGDIVLTRSMVDGNTASAAVARTVGGGGLQVWGLDGPSDITITDSVISGNRVISTEPAYGDANGGGLWTFGTVRALRSRIHGNSVESASFDPDERSFTSGGGIDTTDLELRQSTVSGNSVSNQHGMKNTGGGGITVAGAALITNSTLEGNQSNVFGGGLMHNGGIQGVSALHIANSTLSGNNAGIAGGAMLVYPTTTLDNSTLAFNTVAEESPLGVGGLLFVPGGDDATLNVRSSILSGNQAGAGSAYGIDLAGLSGDTVIVTGSHNLIGDSSGVDLPADTLDSNPLLLPLADNGGLTRTHAPAEGSPAIDAGDNPDGLPFDQRGKGYPRVFGDSADIGALEVQPSSDRIFFDGFEL